MATPSGAPLTSDYHTSPDVPRVYQEWESNDWLPHSLHRGYVYIGGGRFLLIPPNKLG